MEDTRPDAPGSPDRRSSAYLLLCGFVTLLAAELVVYSLTYGFVWDEGFHLLAGQMVNAGQRPYLDFCFPQTPLNAYWNAGVMRIFGHGWRAIHVLAALLATGAAMLTADYLFFRFPAPKWRLAAAMAGAAFIALNQMVVYFAPTGQAYAMCLFMIVAAFRAAIVAVERRGSLWAAAAGFLAATGAGFSLLTALASPVLLAWILYYRQAGSRWKKFGAFVAGAIVPFLPLVWLFVQGPRQTFFNVFQYQAYYRRVNWGNVLQQDLEVMMSWTDSLPAVFMGLLAIAGLVYVIRRSGWTPAQRAEFYLCGWLTLGLSAEIATAHPTFERYFLLVVPFLAILAAAGMYSLGSRLVPPVRPMRAAVLLTVLLALALGKRVYDDRDGTSWAKMEKVAPKVAEVTPPGATLWADELTLFLLNRPPMDGMEFAYAHKIELPQAQERLYHIISNAELKRRAAEGAFSTVETCEDSDVIKDLNLAQLYAQKAEIGDCSVFWQKVNPPK